MSVPIFQVDAFAREPFQGNPAAIVILEEDRESAWMQSMAVEMNLSETAFVRHLRENCFQLRWFTPAAEADLCGHATVAAAHALREHGCIGNGQEIIFESRSGNLPVRFVGSDIELNFPVTPAIAVEEPAGLVDSFQVDGNRPVINYCGRSKFDYLLEVSVESDVHGLTVDFRQLASVECRGVTVTALADESSQYDFVSRFFAPAAGIDEDPVTGSAHCCLVDFWSKKLEQEELTGYQASGRGGIVQMKVNGDRVLLSGSAVTVFRGELLI